MPDQPCAPCCQSCVPTCSCKPSASPMPDSARSCSRSRRPPAAHAVWSSLRSRQPMLGSSSPPRGRCLHHAQARPQGRRCHDRKIAPRDRPSQRLLHIRIDIAGIEEFQQPIYLSASLYPELAKAPERSLPLPLLGSQASSDSSSDGGGL